MAQGYIWHLLKQNHQKYKSAMIYLYIAEGCINNYLKHIAISRSEVQNK